MNQPLNSSADKPLAQPEAWVDVHGDHLFAFALARLRNTTMAEDLVQETFLAALKSKKPFAGRSAERTWLTGILKNKIYDHFRKAGRERNFTDLEFQADADDERFVAEGRLKGAWSPEHAPVEWPTAGASLDNEVFWTTFRDCAGKLPQNVAAAFTMREVDDTSSAEICETLNISEGNLWVMLHRARMALRRCLEMNWFAKQEAAL